VVAREVTGLISVLLRPNSAVTGLKSGHYNGPSSTLHCAATVIAEKAAAPSARLRKAPLGTEGQGIAGMP
jgi:hypothetical protein